MSLTFDTVRQLARALPHVEQSGSTGMPALKVKGKLLAWLREDPEVLAVKVGPVSREYLLRVQPEIFFITDHYRDYPIVLIRLPRIKRRELAEVLEEAWRQVAPKRMRAAYDLKRPSSSRSRSRPGDAGSVDAYLASVPADVRAGLQKLRKAISAAAPGAEEGFSYGLPAFRLHGRPLVCYAAAKHHGSFFPMSPLVIQAHAAELKAYETSKGTIRFPAGNPPPAALVKKIVKARIAESRKGRE